MRAIAVAEYGADARLGEYDKPVAGPGQVLLRVLAAGMNPMDRAIASGALRDSFPATFPLILGVDVVGLVEEVGAGPGPYSVGDRVFGQLLTLPLGLRGAYAEYVSITADATLTTVPESLSNEVAATLPTPGVTALQVARSMEPLAARAIAVVGAGGAVGGFLTQLLSASGARVLAIALPGQADRVRSYGAREVVDATASPTDDLRRAVPDGVDGLVDLVSPPEQFASLVEAVRPGGIAISSRYAADIDDAANRTVRGVNFVVQMTIRDLQAVGELSASGRLVPPSIRTVRFEDVLAFLNGAKNEFDGKTVVRPE